jgi:F0F1-type ATP synthase membrane subunit b/b'
MLAATTPETSSHFWPRLLVFVVLVFILIVFFKKEVNDFMRNNYKKISTPETNDTYTNNK